MFMVKEELQYVKKLTLTKLRSGKRGYNIYFAIMFFMMISNLIPAIVMLLQNKSTPSIIEIQEFSSSIFWGFMIGVTVLNVIYRKENDYTAIYPQTNNTRFLSFVLDSYFLVFVVSVTVLAMFLIDFTTLRIIALFNKNIVFALNFDIGFVITGFFIFLIYSLLTSSLIVLVGTLIRKFGFYAIVTLFAIGATFIININWSLIKNVLKLLGFFIYEHNIVLFFLKAIITFLLLNSISFLLNHYTVYYRTNKINKAIAFIVTTVVIVLSIGFTLTAGSVFFLSAGSTRSTNVHEVNSSFKSINFDISQLERNSTIKVVSSKNIIKTGDIKQYDMYFSAQEPIKVTGNKLTVIYEYPIEIINGINITDYTKPHFSASMKGNTLYLNYEYNKDLKLVIQPIWGMASQFATYKNKNVTTQFWSHSESSSAGGVNIVVE